jgi:hypothetical protein
MSFTKEDVKNNKDVTSKKTITIAFRIPKSYKQFIDENDISIKLLFMKACEELEPELKENIKDDKYTVFSQTI